MATRSPPAPTSRPEPGDPLLAALARVPAVDLTHGVGHRAVPGARLGRFLLVHELGRGRSGTVFEAFDEERERPVALKVLAPGPSAAPRSAAWARGEAADFRRLDHPNIVSLQGIGTCHAGAFLVFELLRGRTLRQRLEDGPLDLEGALRIAGGAGRAMAHAHAVGVVHRGLSAARVFVCDDGAVKVLHFSPARRLPSCTADGPGPEASPEQQAGWPGDERSDLYALTLVLQQLLAAVTRTGRTSSRAVALPQRLRRLLASGLAPEPSARPQSAGEWLDELSAVRSGLGGRHPWRGLFAARS